MFAVVYIPNFELQALLRHEPELRSAPVALLSDATVKASALQMTSAAAEAGVTVGMASTQAQARCGALVFRTRSTGQEQIAQEALIECVYAFSANVESTAPGVSTIDLRGLTEFDREPKAQAFERWSKSIIERLRAVGLESRIGIAATTGLALQAAQCAEPIFWIQDPEEFWERVPIANTTAPAGLRDILERWGIRTVAAFLKLGREAIAERLGVEGIELFETCRAETIRPLRLTQPRAVYEEFMDFDREIETMEPLLFIVRRFLEQLSARVGVRGLAIQELSLSLHLASGSLHERTLRVPSPTRDVEALFRILHNYLENVRTESAVTGVRLRATPCREQQQQFELFESAVRNPNQFFETVGRLNALLGLDRVGTPVVADSHKPDDVRVDPVRIDVRQNPNVPGRTRIQIGLTLRRLRPPVPATVQMHNDQPRAFNSSRYSGAIKEVRGPWRRSGNWWEKGWNREEWDVQTTRGELFRLSRENEQWSIEGAYD